MSARAFIPSAPEVGREVLIVVGGAIIAAALVGAFPALRQWLQAQWTGQPCDCRN